MRLRKKEQALLGMQLHFLNRCVCCSRPRGNQTPASSSFDYELMPATLRPCSWPASLVSLDLKLPASWVTNSRGYWFLWWPRDSLAGLSSSRLHKPTYQAHCRVPHAFCWLWSFQAGFLKPFPLTGSLCLRNFQVTSAI